MDIVLQLQQLIKLIGMKELEFLDRNIKTDAPYSD